MINHEKANVADAMTEEVDSRGEVMPNKKEHSVIFKKKLVGGRTRVTTDEDAILGLRGIGTEIRLYK